MQPPYTPEQKLDLPTAGSEGWGEEYLSRCSVGKMFTVKAIRGEESTRIKGMGGEVERMAEREVSESIACCPLGSGCWISHH